MNWVAVIRRRMRREDGQVVPLVVLWMFVLIGFAALVIDVGRLYIAQEQLQNAVNASALAAGRDLPNATTAYSAAVAYGGASGENNALGGYGVSATTPNVTFQCDTYGLDYDDGVCPSDTSGASCHPSGSQAPSSTTCNAVLVTESATVKTTFAGLFKLPSWTISANAIASAGGGGYFPMHAYVILDNTESMVNTQCSSSVSGNGNGSDSTYTIPESGNNPTKLDCAKSGVRALLQLLWPCKSSNACGAVTANSSGLGANVSDPDDEVGMLVVPAITGNPPSNSILDDETDCNTDPSYTSSTWDEYPPWTSYTYSSSSANGGIPASDEYLGYEAIGLSSDYRASDSLTNNTLNWVANTDPADTSPSPLVESVDWGQCPSNAYPATTTNTTCSGGGGGHGGGGGGSNCTTTTTNPDPYDYGLKDIGGHGSYLAGAITEAQYLLQQNAEPGVENVIIIESDGEMTDPVKFAGGTESDTSCLDAYNAATQAKLNTSTDTTIYTIEYGSSSSNGTCGPDSPTDTYDNPATLMQDMASSSSDYFDDPSAGDLTATFEQVGEDLTLPRLIPDCTQSPPSC